MCTTAEDTEGPGTVDGFCEPALRLYEAALREGRLPRTDLAEAPCLAQRGLILPDPDDERWGLTNARAVIAAGGRKMGISVRTCRSHIARLMHTLGTLLIHSGTARTDPHGPPA